MRHRRVPPDDEEQLRQLPPVGHPGHHEAREGQGRGGHHLRAHPRRRHHLLRQPRGERPLRVQGAEPRHHRQPLRRKPQRRGGESIYERYL